MLRKLLHAIALFTFIFSTSAVANSLLSYRFNHLTTDQGLPSNGVTALYQDPKGLIWIGTVNGLALYDGKKIKVFTNRDSTKQNISSERIAVLYAHEDHLWIGGNNGLDALNMHTHQLQHIGAADTQNDKSRQITGIQKKNPQQIWIATQVGLFIYDIVSKQFAPVSVPLNALQSKDQNIRSLLSDQQGGVWLSIGSQVFHFDQNAILKEQFDTQTGVLPLGKSSTEQKKLSIIDLQVRQLGLDHQHRLWVGMAGALQVWKRNALGTMEPDPIQQEIKAPKASVSSFVEDQEKTMWIGLVGDSGLFRWNETEKYLEHVKHLEGIPTSLNSNSISQIMQDQNGILWVGTWEMGLNFVDLHNHAISAYIRIPEDPNSLTHNSIKSILPINENEVWAAAYRGGLNKINLQTGQVKRIHRDQLLIKRIKKIIFSKEKKLWIAGDEGLSLFDPITEKSSAIDLQAKDSSAISIGALCLDKQGNVWAGSNAGLYRIDAQGMLTIYRSDNQNLRGLPAARINDILLDHQDQIWISAGSELYMWQAQTDQFQRVQINKEKIKKPIGVRYVYQDSKHDFWIISNLGLLRLLQDPQKNWFLQPVELDFNGQDHQFISIVADRQHSLWLGSEAGLTYYNPTSNKTKFYSAATYFGTGFNYGASSIGFDGSILLGAEGLIRIKPEQLIENKAAPNVILSDILVFNHSISTIHIDKKTERLQENLPLISEPIHQLKSIQFNHRDNMLSFELSALHFYNAMLNQYAWKLEPYDKNWIYGLANLNVATYTNLDPGHYRLLAKAANPDGVWSEEKLLLEIEITPPFWRTWWWYSLITISIALILFSIYRARIKRLKNYQTHLENQVSFRTQEVSQQREVAEKARADLAYLSEIGREITTSLNVEQVQETLYRAIHQLITSDTFGMGMLNSEKNQIEFNFIRQNGVAILPYVRSMHALEQFAVQCILQKQSFLIEEFPYPTNEINAYTQHNNDSTKDKATNNINAGQHLRLINGEIAKPARSGIYVPLLIQDKVIGLISVLDAHAQAFNKNDLTLLRTLADYAAIALENASSFQFLKQTQAKLVEQEKMAALGFLVAGVAHELNTPIGNTLMAASTLSDEVQELAHSIEQGSLKRSLLDHFNENAQRITKLMIHSLETASNLIQAFKQLAVDQSSERRRNFELLSVGEEVQLTLANQVKLHQAELTLEIEDALWLDSYPGPLSQVLSNLVLNALIHGFEAKSGGKIHIKGSHYEDDWIELIITDDGVGIPEANIKRVFEPFFTTRLGSGGSGLGLHICYNIVSNLLGGRIHLYSQVGKGCRFTIHIPKTAPPHANIVRPEK